MDNRNLFSPRALIVIAAASGALAACSGHDDASGSNSALAAGAAVCATPDAAVPSVESHTLNLWPPNHKFHQVAASDCVSAVDACGNALQGEFIWASSDEPIDDIGDGHFGPDIGLAGDTGHACVRSERQGPKDGRVYKLGVRVTDGQGNTSEGECLVIVDHDQRGVTGEDSGDAYRIEFSADDVGTDCGGEVSPPADAGTGTGGNGSGGNGSAGEGSGGSSEGSGGTSEGSGGTSEGSGGTSEGSGGTSEGSGGTSEGSGGTSEGSGGTSEGSGGTSEGSGGTDGPD
jgi:hypothetical protein